MKFAFIHAEKAQFEVSALCRNLGVSRQGYYAYSKRKPGLRQAREQALQQRLKTLHAESRGTYGSPRLHDALRKEGKYRVLRDVACSSSSSSTGNSAGASSGTGGGASSAGAGGTAASDAVVGGFIVELVPQKSDTPPFTNVSGEVFDGPSPATLVWDMKGESAGCQLLEPRVPFCDPSCGGSAVCVADGVCQAYPTAKDLGPVMVKGLGDDLTMTAIANTYQADVKTPYPAAEEGASVSIAVSGGPYGAFELNTPMVSPLEAPADTLQLDTGKALSLSWTSPGASAASRIAVKVDISHHGGTKGKIECDVPDTGLLEISADLITKLHALGVAGYPSVALTRSTSAETAIVPGKVSLQALSAISIDLEVAGVTSCSTDDDCATGKTCQSDETCSP